MIRLLLASLAVGALIAAFTPEPIFQPQAIAHAAAVEYLIKDGVRQPTHLYILRAGQQPDRKLILAALQVSCRAGAICK
jgi:hypothetical protein